MHRFLKKDRRYVVWGYGARALNPTRSCTGDFGSKRNAIEACLGLRKYVENRCRTMVQLRFFSKFVLPSACIIRWSEADASVDWSLVVTRVKNLCESIEPVARRGIIALRHRTSVTKEAVVSLWAPSVNTVTKRKTVTESEEPLAIHWIYILYWQWTFDKVQSTVQRFKTFASTSE